MGMPITVELVDRQATTEHIDQVYDYFQYVDETFSTYKPTSIISRLNRKEIELADTNGDVQTIFRLAEETKRQTNGYFDIEHNGNIDPSGIVKGWAIDEAAKLLGGFGLINYFVEAGGDIAAVGKNDHGQLWRFGIRNPFQHAEIVKVIQLSNAGMATSGTYVRGEHIYNPKTNKPANEIISLTVIGPNVYEADRFATGAFAMGQAGIQFIEALPGFEGYMIDHRGTATMTSGFTRYVVSQ